MKLKGSFLFQMSQTEYNQFSKNFYYILFHEHRDIFYICVCAQHICVGVCILLICNFFSMKNWLSNVNAAGKCEFKNIKWCEFFIVSSPDKNESDVRSRQCLEKTPLEISAILSRNQWVLHLGRNWEIAPSIQPTRDCRL